MQQRERKRQGSDGQERERYGRVRLERDSAVVKVADSESVTVAEGEWCMVVVRGSEREKQRR